MCRDPILPGSACLEAISRVKPEVLRYDDNVHFIPSAKLRAWQERMKVLLWQQKQKGGVIDPNSEDDVIDETWVSLIMTLLNLLCLVSQCVYKSRRDLSALYIYIYPMHTSL